MNRQQAIAFHRKQLSPYSTQSQIDRHTRAIAKLESMTDAEYMAEREQSRADASPAVNAAVARMAAELMAKCR